MISRLENVTFDRRLYLMHPAQRSLVRILTYSFLICIIGLTAASLLSDIERVRWAGVLLLLMLLEYAFHAGRSHFTLRDLAWGRVPNNNIALCIDREASRLLLWAYETSLARKADLEICLLYRLSERRAPMGALRRLEVDQEQFHHRVAEELEQSVRPDRVPVKEAYIDQIRHICQRAAVRAAEHGLERISVDSLFASVVAESHPRVLRMLDFYSLTPEDIDAALVFGSHTKRSVSPYLGGFALKHGASTAHRVNRSFTSRPTPVLDSFAKDVTDYVRDGYGGFLIGHNEEFDQMLDLLSRPGKRNVLLVGDPGVGKEALVYHLAYRIVTDAVPGPLFDRRVVEVSLTNMLSGSSREEITQRLQAIANEIVAAGNILLYLPDAHLLEKSSPEGEVSLADIFIPIIKSNAFPVIAATYPKEFKQFIDSRPAFADAFDPIRVQELSQKDSIRLLAYSALIAEKKYKVSVSYSAVKRAVTLASKYLRSRPLPSSAQELLQEVIVDNAQRGEKWIQEKHVVAVVERKIKMPVQAATGMEAQQLLKLEDTIHAAYIDQDEAVTAVAQALRAYRSGLGRKGGPIASFLFVGPTGVGKTELTKMLATLYFGAESFMVRFDMSEYQEKDSLTRLIGSNDGKLAGQLTESVSHQPYGVILLDEFEKAHPDILNLFLQVFDDGRLTDATGRTVDFQNMIIIATSNAHSVLIQQHVQEHHSIEGLSEELKKRLTEYFKPELINRFSDIIIFKPLSREDLKQIVDLTLRGLAKLVSETQGIALTFNEPAKEKISHLGYDPAFGARPLRKVIDRNIKAALSEKILSGQLRRGDTIHVELDTGGEFTFKA